MSVFSDETLMAFADGELDPAARAAVDAAMRDDPEIEKRVAQHQALRARVRLAYSAELDDAPPARLLAAARGPSAETPSKAAASVTNLADVRTASTVRTRRQTAAPVRWRPLLSMAASLLVGVGIGYGVLRQSNPVTIRDGEWVASGVLASALSNQLGNERASTAAVRLDLSFMSKSGDYCRAFSMTGRGSSAGVACHHGDEWQIRTLAKSAQGADAGAQDNYRTASSVLSPLILAAIQQQISGEPLDQAGETLAQRRGWRASVH